ncbi:MAG TPA: UDP-N-acetylmuramoyl-L-alanine--D-glutamate ligase [Vicinamibacteria bacterium]
MELEGRHVVVVGLARSGLSAAAFLAARGARVVATDRKPAAELPPDVGALASRGVQLELSGHRPDTFTAADLVVVSPGVPWDLPEVQVARARGVPVMAEIEMAYRFARGTVAAVTGTKGKSTTTAALGAMLGAAGRDARVGGNIGRPFTDLLEAQTSDTVFVLEVSSFQLEGTETFHPHVAAFLNLSADHLDRHPSFEAYASAKARIFANQTAEDWAVLNADDPGVLARAQGARSRRLTFTAAPREGDGAFFEDGEARLRRSGRTETLFALGRLRLPGAHLAIDLLAAGAAARLLGAPPDAIARAAEGFPGVEHVLERVAEVDGVAYFNDSKATNVDAARKSLEAFAGPLLLIAGGRYKGGDFRELRAPARGRVRAVLAIGEARPLLIDAFTPVCPVVPCDSMAEAVRGAHALAAPGDTVLLAPGCSSFDMFTDYADRGRAFKEEVARLG